MSINPSEAPLDPNAKAGQTACAIPGCGAPATHSAYLSGTRIPETRRVCFDHWRDIQAGRIELRLASPGQRPRR